MALHPQFTAYDLTGAARQVIYTIGDTGGQINKNQYITIFVRSDIDLDDVSATLRVEASVQLDADTATGSEWHVLEGLETLEAGKVYRIALLAPHLALSQDSSGTPTGLVYVGTNL